MKISKLLSIIAGAITLFTIIFLPLFRLGGQYGWGPYFFYGVLRDLPSHVYLTFQYGELIEGILLIIITLFPLLMDFSVCCYLKYESNSYFRTNRCCYCARYWYLFFNPSII
ncbi:MAG: hypothetical protein ACFE85_01100 [Candidatus Hodarchaeota archaeon]